MSHSAMRKTATNAFDDRKYIFTPLVEADKQFAIMMRDSFTGKDCIWSGGYLEGNMTAAIDRNNIKGYITKQKAQKDIANIFLNGQNARIVTMQEAEIFIGTQYA